MISPPCFLSSAKAVLSSASLKLQLLALHTNSFYSSRCRTLKHLLSFFRLLVVNGDTFPVQLLYFLFISFLGFLSLKLAGETPPPYTSLDVFFTSVSACTTSSISVVEMETFSNKQLIIITALMFTGGEVFASLLEAIAKTMKLQHAADEYMNFISYKALCYLIPLYLIAVHVIGASFIFVYFVLDAGARAVLRRKRLQLLTFSLFTATSTFSNCGFTPNNENMVAFRKNSGLLLLLIPLVLMGNTLYAPMLVVMIRVMEKITKRSVFSYMLDHRKAIGFTHLLSGGHCRLLVGTVLGFVLVQFLMFCSLEWDSAAMTGMSRVEKTVASLFQVVNSRHAGESVVDLSALSPAMVVFFILMMYLPPYTSFMIERETPDGTRKRGNAVWERLLFSQLTYITVFVILICITEAEKLKKDPLNFSVLFIVLEVMSAYGNVGFSAGYSCERKLVPESSCRYVSYGLSGKWSTKGKILLVLVMLFGRLKRQSLRTGKYWKLR